MGRVLLILLQREFRMVYRRPSDMLLPIFFVALVVLLFAIALQSGQFNLGEAEDALASPKISLGIIWVTVMLAHLLAQEHLFRDDIQDGTAEQWALAPLPLPFLLLLRLSANWLSTLGPMIVLAPLFALILGLPSEALPWLLLSLLLGSPCLHLIAATAAMLLAGLRGGGAVLALLVLPLWLPVMIFGINMVNAQLAGASVLPALTLLTGLLLLTLVLAPLAQAAAFRISLE